MRGLSLSPRWAAWLMAALCWAAQAQAHAPPAGLRPTTPAHALRHDDVQLDERTNHLAGELRCLVCQNQTIAESTAPLARQLKAEVRHRLASGASEQQVRDFMAQRYGDFVLYRPPVSQLTWLLWGGPLLLLLLGGLLMRGPRPAHAAELIDDDSDGW